MTSLFSPRIGIMLDLFAIIC